MDVSIVICSCNRADSLRKTLESLVKMVTPLGATWEVVVVDNNSRDTTREVVDAFARNNPGLARYVFEKRQGKSFALNTGLGNARGDIIAFTDDDCIVSHNWIASIIGEFEADQCLTGIGGMVKLYNKQDKPVAIRMAEDRATVSDSGFDPTFIPIIGCNMAFRKTAFDAIGGFDTDLGPGCKMNAVAEDLDFLYRICTNGFRVIYAPEVLVYHNHGRSDDSKVQAAKEAYIVGRGAFYYKHIRALDRRVLKMAYWEVNSTIRELMKDLVAGKSVGAHKKRLRACVRGAIYKMRCARNIAI